MKNKRLILLIVFIAILCFVFGNSFLSPETSSKISSFVGEFLAKIFGSGNGESMMGGLSVRKAAHFVEFAFLGAVTALLFDSFVLSGVVRGCATVIVGLLVPVLDETIQIFSGRGSSLRDVWIDVGGFVFGCVIVYLVAYLADFLKEKRKKQL